MGEEKTFKDWMMRLDGKDKGLHIQTIETVTGSGVPDLNICYDGIEGWVELKVGKVAKLRPSQFAWGMRRSKNCSGKVFVFLYDAESNTINVWKFPHIKVQGTMSDKLLYIHSEPCRKYHRRDFNEETLKNILAM